ncbi:Uncharacterised protein [Klebsiella pneumoniae]|nr:Uncharacterised protein [Klebsiella pneumoniae]
MIAALEDSIDKLGVFMNSMILDALKEGIALVSR